MQNSHLSSLDASSFLVHIFNHIGILRVFLKPEIIAICTGFFTLFIQINIRFLYFFHFNIQENEKNNDFLCLIYWKQHKKRTFFPLLFCIRWFLCTVGLSLKETANMKATKPTNSSWNIDNQLNCKRVRLNHMMESDNFVGTNARTLLFCNSLVYLLFFIVWHVYQSCWVSGVELRWPPTLHFDHIYTCNHTLFWYSSRW